MKKIANIILFLYPILAFTQDKDSIVTTTDTIRYTIELEEVVLTEDGVYTLTEEQKRMAILKRRVYKTYPYAKIASEKLVAMNEMMGKLKTEKEKKKYFKIVEKYLTEEFEAKLKKLSRKDGQILVKLIHRQTGTTTYDLIKDFKSGWKAFWSNNTARLFDINLKTEYKPYTSLEDFNIESILLTAFQNYALPRQEAKVPIDLDKLIATWKEKTAEMKAEKANQ
jgi:sulfur relay (sulfurtransferase) DsrF/TusC family protein